VLRFAHIQQARPRIHATNSGHRVPAIRRGLLRFVGTRVVRRGADPRAKGFRRFGGFDRLIRPSGSRTRS